MKKNNFMRIASVLMVLTLLSTCAISGTFAKYVTSDKSEDSARVAKFGVTVTMADNSNFDMDYKTDEKSGTDPYNATLSVSAASDARKNVVAPGTGSTNANVSTDGKLVFSIAGTPEVATRITIEMTEDEEIFIKKADGSSYIPVVWTLKQVGDAEGKITEQSPVELKKGTLSEIKTFLNEYSGTVYQPNTNLGAKFELTWEWAFQTGEDDNEKAANDILDTCLGDLAAGEKLKKLDNSGSEMVDGTDYNLEIKYKLTVTVTQID